MRRREVGEWSESDVAEITSIVEHLVFDAADGDTSIPQAKLAEILEAVNYCIEQGRQVLSDTESISGLSQALVSREDVSALHLYEAGYESVVEKAKRALSKYNILSSSFEDYGVEEYGVTFRDEIPRALASFDPRFRPAEATIFSYHLPLRGDAPVGIDAILGAVERIGEEQEFLLHFDEAYVREIAQMISSDGENLCEALRRA